MAVLFMVTGEYASQAVASLISNPTDREQVARQAAESMGAKILFWGMNPGSNGGWEVVVIYDVPNPNVHFALYSSVVASGAFASIKATRLLTSAEFVEGLKGAQQVKYQPPQG